MSATSTTDLEPLSDHGARSRARRIAAAHVALPRASRHFSARQTYVDASFLNPVSQVLVLVAIVAAQQPDGCAAPIEPNSLTLDK